MTVLLTTLSILSALLGAVVLGLSLIGLQRARRERDSLEQRAEEIVLSTMQAPEDDRYFVLDFDESESSQGAPHRAVASGDTLWAIAERFHEDGATHLQLRPFGSAR